jgi:hypothetical protein
MQMTLKDWLDKGGRLEHPSRPDTALHKASGENDANFRATNLNLNSERIPRSLLRG